MARIFEGASRFSANISLFNDFSQHADLRSDLQRLYNHIAPVAIHSSSARVDAPKCHEDTREAVQGDISSWSASHNRSEAPPQREDILWLTGPAGTGKTAIMGTISDILAKAGQLVATFYFSSAMGAAGTTSKRFFVTTLAYQMAVHPALKGSLGPSILAAVRENPAIFDMCLKRQIEVLILEPLATWEPSTEPTSPSPSCILVDGVDECGEPGDGPSSSSRAGDQIEVLSVLLQAVSDAAFPFHIIIASRPETWVRSFFAENAAGTVHEIFLDERYSPDDDIRLYLKSKFAERCRRSSIYSLNWPPEEAIDKLVEDASGQFIYAATVLRWVDTPGTDARAQLSAILNLRDESMSDSKPFAMLDALYSSILNSTPSPNTNILWLKGIRAIQDAFEGYYYPPSAWTLDRCFESYEGQALSLRGVLPSLLHTVGNPTDMRSSKHHYRNVKPLYWDDSEWDTCYAFYHKSFLDYLEDDMRCGAAFPRATQARFEQWLGSRFSQILNRKGMLLIPPQVLC